MSNLSLQKLKDTTSMGDYCVAKDIYDRLLQIENEELWLVCLIYKAGIIEGKRQDRARRKGQKEGVAI